MISGTNKASSSSKVKIDLRMYVASVFVIKQEIALYFG